MKLVFPKFARWFAGLLLALLAVHVGVESVSAQTGSSGDLVRKLQGGGYNIYVRHAATDWSQKDKIGRLEDTASCDGTKVRQLSARGREQALATGTALKALGIKFGNVFSSPYCRSAETARMMSGKDPELTHDLMNLRSAQLVGGREAVVTRTRKRLSQRPGNGANGLYSAHGNLGKAATGEYLAEGELLIVKPMGDGKFGIEGRLKLEDLEKLADN